jgi:hypothetical protein
MLQGSLGRTKPDWRLVRQGSASPVISDKRLADRKRFLPPGARRGSINIQHCSIMPDVGLTTAQEPLPADVKVIIKYSVEVGGLPVYQETYDVDKLAAELAADRSNFKELWLRRVECVVNCRHKEAFSASLTGCLAAGMKQ